MAVYVYVCGYVGMCVFMYVGVYVFTLRSASLALFAKTHMTQFPMLQMGARRSVTTILRDITRLSIFC